MRQRRILLQAAAAGVVVSAWTQAGAERVVGPWPQFPVNLIVPFPAGGPSAILGKLIAQAFERQTGQPMRLIYQSGAGGVQGANFASKAEANGNNLFIGGSYLAVARIFAQQEEFDWLQDLRPLALIAEVPQVLTINAAHLRVRTFTELLAELRRNPKRYRIATAGVGSSGHIAAAIFKQQMRVNFEFVHFRGAGPAVQDLLNGSVDMMLDGILSSLSHVQAGKLKAMFVTGEKRLLVMPNVPSAQELGIEGLNSIPWYGLFAPNHISNTQAQHIQNIFQKISLDSELLANLDAAGIRWGALYGDEFRALVEQETLRWAQRVKQLELQNVWGKYSKEGLM